jgi:hypothetical protein
MLASMRVVKAQLAAFKLARLAVEKINERKPTGRDLFLRVVRVRSEKVAVTAGRDLSLRVSDRKFLDPELIQHSWQYSTDTLQNDALMFSQIHEHARAAMVVVRNSRVSARRNHLTRLKLGLMLQGVVNEFFEFLRSQELIQHQAL